LRQAAGGGYLPVLCDKLLMTEGGGLYLAGPALSKTADESGMPSTRPSTLVVNRQSSP